MKLFFLNSNIFVPKLPPRVIIGYVVGALVLALSAGTLFSFNESLSILSMSSHVEQIEAQVVTVTPTKVQTDFQVTYTNEGFIPKRLEVPLGSRVLFTNNSDTPMWVGSDPHPTHTDHPVFDAQKVYAKGETYQFTFDSSGTFGFHNHTRSLDRGFVVVFDDTLASNSTLNKTIPSQQPQRDALIALFKPDDPNSIYTIIDAIQADSALSLNCHDIAHDLGQKSYELYGFSEAMTFNNPNHVKHPLVQYICAGGYMHGILEALSLHKPEFLQTPDVICETIPDPDKPSCYHGIGHVFMLANGRDAQTSITDCRKVQEPSSVYRCFEGVRMEQFWGNTEHIGTSTLGWDINDPLSSCVSAQIDEKPTCFLYSTFGYLRMHPKDYSGAVALCTQDYLAQSDTNFCLKGLGITMMSKFKGQHLEGSTVYVSALPDEERRSFYQGVLHYALLSGVTKTVLTNTCMLFGADAMLCAEVLEESN